MRRLQVGLFVLALLLLLASLGFVGSIVGDALWRAGVAALLVDLVCMRLWPSAPALG
jgi:preprotein translocase subunit SecF